MLPYFLMIGVPAVAALYSSRSAQASFYLFVVFVIFVGVIGLRWNIGPDWFAYTTHFNRYENMTAADILADGEVGWGIVVKLATSFGWGMTGLTLMSALVFTFGVCAIARACQEPMIAMVAAVPYLSIAVAMSGMRQAMAMGVVFLVLARWYRWPMLWKILGILVAASFHFSALALWAVIVLEARLSLAQRIFAATAIGGAVSYLALAASSRLDEYSTNYMVGGAAANAPGAIFHVLLTAAPALVYFVVRRRWLTVYGRLPVIDWFAGIGAVALLLVFIAPTATDRMTLYFAGIALVIQANLPQIWQRPTEQGAVRIALIVLNLIAMSVFLFAGNKSSSFVPYQSIFSEGIDPSAGVYVPDEFDDLDY